MLFQRYNSFKTDVFGPSNRSRAKVTWPDRKRRVLCRNFWRPIFEGRFFISQKLSNRLFWNLEYWFDLIQERYWPSFNFIGHVTLILDQFEGPKTSVLKLLYLWNSMVLFIFYSFIKSKSFQKTIAVHCFFRLCNLFRDIGHYQFFN